MILRRVLAILVVPTLLAFTGCAVGWNHTSDAALERNFVEHQAEIEALLAEVQADPPLETIQHRTLIYAGRLLNVDDADFSSVEKLGLSHERWQRYQRELRNLGVVSVIKGKGDVEFRVDSGSVLNGDSYKGYEYTPSAPYHIRASLDAYRRSDEDKDKFGNWGVCKPLKKNWYLYLFVNR
jgi:hypothetical protein